MEKPKKTLYHSELVKAGQCVLDVGKTIASTKKVGTFITFVKFGGADRTYQCETAEIAEKLGKRAGQRCTVQAAGAKGEVGTLKIISAEWLPKDTPDDADGGDSEPAPARPAAKAPAPRAAEPEPEPQAEAPQAQERPARSQMSPAAALNGALFRYVNLQLKIQVFLAQMYQELETKRGIRLSPEEKSGLAGQLFIQLNRDLQLGMTAVPSDHLIDITPKQPAPKAPVAAAPNPDDDGRDPQPGGAQ